ncbi:metallophosphatase [Clostridia bacterium]|nr:metallophosphatase [Clostridia bacterium]
MRIKKNYIVSQVIMLFVMLFVLPINASAQVQTEQKITILHTNDVHARTTGETYLASLVEQKKAQQENVLVFSAGDVLHGQPFASISKGESMVDIMNLVGYDAMTAGNHDFQYGLERLQELCAKMNFPLLVANIVRKTDQKNVFEKNYLIKEIEGIKIGVFGLITPETETKTDPRNVSQIEFLPPIDAAKQAVKQLKAEGVQVIIALTHLGVDEESLAVNRSDNLAKEVPEIDLIIDGHSHTVLPEGLLVGNTLIAQTGAHGENIGEVELTFQNGVLVQKKATLIGDLTKSEIKENEEIKQYLEQMKQENQTVLNQVVGNTPVELKGERELVRTQETNLTNLIADALRYYTQADLVIFNGGAVRSSIPKGDIRIENVFNVLPFGNMVVTKEISGANFLLAVEHGLSVYPNELGGFAQIGGMKISFDPTQPPGSRVGHVEMEDGTAFDRNKKYIVAMNDFLSFGGDSYTMLQSKEKYWEYGSIDDALFAYLKTNPVITDEVKGSLKAEKSLDIQQENSTQKVQKYEVKINDNLTKIAKKFGTTWQKIAQYNQLKNPNLIFPKQILLIP